MGFFQLTFCIKEVDGKVFHFTFCFVGYGVAFAGCCGGCHGHFDCISVGRYNGVFGFIAFFPVGNFQIGYDGTIHLVQLNSVLNIAAQRFMVADEGFLVQCRHDVFDAVDGTFHIQCEAALVIGAFVNVEYGVVSCLATGCARSEGGHGLVFRFCQVPVVHVFYIIFVEVGLLHGTGQVCVGQHEVFHVVLDADT